MKNLDEKLTKFYTLKRCVKLINELINPNENNEVENQPLRDLVTFVGFLNFSLKECVKFAFPDSTKTLIVGEVETIDQSGNLVKMPKLNNALNIGTKDNPSYVFQPSNLIKSFKYRFAEQVKDFYAEQEKKEQEKKKKEKALKKALKKASKASKQEKELTDKQKEELRIKSEKASARREYKRQIFLCKDLASLKVLQREIEGKKLQSPDLYQSIKTMRAKLQSSVDNAFSTEQKEVAI